MDHRMAMDGIRAFERASDGSWKQTPETQKVLGIIREAGGKDFNIQPSPSILAINGEGQWGLGGGVHYTDGSGTYVDPIMGNVSTAAHEAAHASFPTAIVSDEAREAAYAKINNMQGAPLGNQARAVYETISKPIMLEEANAQGVAAAAMNKAGYDFNTNGWTEVPTSMTGLVDNIPAALAYPSTYRYGGVYDTGAKQYESMNNIGVDGREYTSEEIDALSRTRRSFLPAIKRQYDAGYNLIK